MHSMYRFSTFLFIWGMIFTNITYAQNSHIDYSSLDNWYAHPEKQDIADTTPSSKIKESQENAKVDVFYIHPTTYLGPKPHGWNADINDEELSKKTEETAIKHQATIFNESGRVYAPKYSQAHYQSYFTSDTIQAKKSFSIAYADVESAFLYFLENFNDGRPIIIAGHSQGTTHGAPLIKKIFDNTELIDKLVVAYLVGMPIPKDYFSNIPPCENADQIQCFCTWRTLAKDYEPPYAANEKNIACINPLTWKTDTSFAPASLNQGTVLKKFKRPKKGIFDAQIHKGYLWTGRPRIFGGRLLKQDDYHIGDFNIFWMNVRNNVALRVNNYLLN